MIFGQDFWPNALGHYFGLVRSSRSKEKMLLKWSVRPRVRAFSLSFVIRVVFFSWHCDLLRRAWFTTSTDTLTLVTSSARTATNYNHSHVPLSKKFLFPSPFCRCSYSSWLGEYWLSLRVVRNYANIITIKQAVSISEKFEQVFAFRNSFR